jgi:DNA-binding transcriptional ArsR family regulator
MTSDRESLEHVLFALADPTRRLLLDRLSSGGEASATTLARNLPITRQAVLKHLTLLERANLVSVRRHGKEQRYAIRPGEAAEAARWMDDLATGWSTRLEAIKRIAESPEMDED